MIYSEVVKNADAIFDGELRLPRNAAIEDNLGFELWNFTRSHNIFEYRIWQMTIMGFHKFTMPELVALLYGRKHSRQKSAKEKKKYEWVYNHNNGRNERRRWLHQSERFTFEKNAGLFHWPPFEMKKIAHCDVVSLKDVKREVSLQTMLKVLRLQTLNVLNVFHVIEPNHSNRPAILVGTIWEIPPSYVGDDIVYNKVGSFAHFFISEL